jgi:hypothetical protein
MKTWQRLMVAAPAAMLCVAATQWAIIGTHAPTGNVGYVGTDVAGVEGTSTQGASGQLGKGLQGVYGEAGSGGSGVVGMGHVGVEGFGSVGDDTSYGVHGIGAEVGVQGNASGTGNSQKGVAGYGVFGVYGYSSSSVTGTAGVLGDGQLCGVRGRAQSSDSLAVGVLGEGPIAVYGVSALGFGIEGSTVNGTGVYGVLQNGGLGHAGYFEGRVHVNGTLSKSAGSFKIDHPLDPGGKYLSHSFVESPDMKNIYDGVVTLSDNGTAIVELPEWFEALNKDFRYQLTCIGEHAPVYVSDEIAENRFRIAGGYAGMKVSWQVTGSRQDAYAKAYPIPVEESKSAPEMGRFLNPELYDAPAGLRIGPSRVSQ